MNVAPAARRDVTQLELIAVELRRKLLEIIYGAGGGHTGGSLSALDILVTLYFHTMRYDPTNPNAPERDRFVLSKGHSVEGFYCVLAKAGFFPEQELSTYGQFGTRLYGHPTMKVPGVEVPTGALGHGLPVATGMALAGKRDGATYRVYALMGDGEQAEGAVWEAAMAASHHGLDNLIGIVDYNGLQISGNVDEVMTLSPLSARWRSFGWNVLEVSGNDIRALSEMFDSLPGATSAEGTARPTLVLAHTTKGKGISFIEGRPEWHHRVPTSVELDRAVAELEVVRQRIGARDTREGRGR